MSISAINCTPIKPQVSFGNTLTDEDGKYVAVRKLTDELNDSLVKSEDIKKPVAVVASVALAGLAAFASGKKLASLVINDNSKIPELFEKGLKKGADSMKKMAANLSKENPATKLDKAKNLAGRVIGAVESTGRKAYSKIAAKGAASAFTNTAGVAAAATVIPAVCSRDTDSDGVSDIMQKGTNAYTGTTTKFDSIIDTATKLSAIAEVLA